MGLFDFLSGSDEAERAQQQNQLALGLYGQQTNNLYNQYQTGALGQLGQSREAALGALNTGLQGQLGAYQSALGGLQGTGTGPLQGAINTLQGTGTQPLQNALAAQQSGLSAVQSGAADAAAAGRAGVAAYDPLTALAGSYAPAVNTYYSSLGIGDPSLARGAFSTSPSYQFEQDEAAKQLMARASQTGAGQSGNTLQALGDRAQNIARTNYGNWQDRLAGFVNPQLQATSGAATGISGANRTLADIYRQGGADIAGAYGNIAGAYGNLFTGQRGINQDVAGAYGNLFAGQRGLGQDIAGQYGNIAGAYGAYGPQVAGTETGYGSDYGNVLGNVTQAKAGVQQGITSGIMQGNRDVAAAGAQNAANFWGLLGAGTKALGAAYGGR